VGLLRVQGEEQAVHTGPWYLDIAVLSKVYLAHA